MKNVVALVLAGGRMGDYGVLTQNRAKGALTFAGNYRIVDFALSNLVNSDIRHIGLIIQYLPGSLIEHVENGQSWDLDIHGSALKIMPPFVGMNQTDWYKGTADAIHQNWNFVRDHKAEHVIILSGEHLFQLDFKEVLSSHISNNADLTIVTRTIPPDKCSPRFGYVTSTESGKITAYHEKPEKPASASVSMGIYVFKAPVLSHYLTENTKAQSHNLPRDIIETCVQERNTWEYRHEGAWEYLENVRDYYNTQIRLLERPVLESLRRWDLQTSLKFRDLGHAPASTIGKSAEIENSLISPGCKIHGAVSNSILSPGVIIEEGAHVRNSILMHDCTVSAGAALDHVIADRDVVIGPDAVAGIMDTDSSLTPAEHPLTLLGKGSSIGIGIVISPGTQLQPGQHISTQESANI